MTGTDRPHPTGTDRAQVTGTGNGRMTGTGRAQVTGIDTAQVAGAGCGRVAGAGRGRVAGAGRARGLALAVLCAATLMIILDGTVVTVALPSIRRDLHVPAASLTWVLNAYLIAFGGLVLLAGRLGDLLGRKRVFLAGLATFTAASLACGLATSLNVLIAARLVQGAGGAMVTAVSLGMITTLYPEPQDRARAVAAYSFTGATGASLGLVLGGLLTQAISWHWIFFVNLPVGVAAGLPAVYLLSPERGRGLRSGADWLGAGLVTAGLMLGVGALVQTGPAGWASARTLGLAAAAIILLTGFAVRQARAAIPLLPPRIIASRTVAGTKLAQLLVIAAAFGFQVLITLYLQQVLGYHPALAGLGLLPTAVVIGLVSLGASARLAGRFGPRTVLLAGLALIALALALLTQLPAQGSYPVHVLPALLIFGLGGGLTLPALAMLGMSAATPDDAGLVSGLFNTTQQVGAALGVAVLTTLASSHAAAAQAAGLASSPALTSGFRLAFGAGVGLVLAAVAVTGILLRPSGGNWRSAKEESQMPRVARS
jgi:EmrB/QacA subfamily drug resistance transporter